MAEKKIVFQVKIANDDRGARVVVNQFDNELDADKLVAQITNVVGKLEDNYAYVSTVVVK